MAAQPQVFKAQAMARDLEVRLKNRIAGITTTAGLDSNRFPTLRVAVGAKSAWVRISTDSARTIADGHVDGLGLEQRVYSPHVTEMLREPAATQDATTVEMVAQLLAELSKNGTKLIIREGTNVEDDTTWAAADATAATTVATVRSDDINPLTSQQ